jgi:hypothetical protein
MEELKQSPDGDQPTEESTEKENDQVETTDSGESDVETPTVEIDGEKYTLDEVKEWKKGNMREADYRKKTQELAEAKREIARAKENPSVNEVVDPEVKAALETLKAAGVATKEDLLLMKAQEEDAKHFKRLIKKHPELKQHEKALKAIGLTDNRAWEDIVKDYGFLSGDKLAKAKKTNPITGAKTAPADEKPKGLPKAGTPEWEAWKKQNLGQGLWS